jgi:hypothetical protein
MCLKFLFLSQVSQNERLTHLDCIFLPRNCFEIVRKD